MEKHPLKTASLFILLSVILIGCGRTSKSSDVGQVEDSVKKIASTKGTGKGTEYSGIYDADILTSNMNCSPQIEAEVELQSEKELFASLFPLTCSQNDGALKCTTHDTSTLAGYIHQDGTFGLHQTQKIENKEKTKTLISAVALTGKLSKDAEGNGAIEIVGYQQSKPKESCKWNATFKLIPEQAR